MDINEIIEKLNDNIQRTGLFDGIIKFENGTLTIETQNSKISEASVHHKINIVSLTEDESIRKLYSLIEKAFTELVITRGLFSKKGTVTSAGGDIRYT